MCGEKLLNIWFQLCAAGSPPHVRGKVTKSFEEHGFVRITPACAGKRCFFACVYTFFEDHPRMCGEKTKKIP